MDPFSLEDWGVGDWRNPDDYPNDPLVRTPVPLLHFAKSPEFGEDAVRRLLWRWEFLRRSNEYRRDWQSLQKRGVQHSEKYGLAYCFPDPKEPRPFPLFFEEFFGMVSDQAPILRWSFDISRPTKPQLQAAKRMLSGAQKHFSHIVPQMVPPAILRQRSRGVEEWPVLLRALDARASGAKYREIGELLCRQRDYDRAAGYGHRLVRRAERMKERISPIRMNLGDDAFTFKGAA